MEMYPIEDEVVQRYKALVDIERGLRVLKSDLEIAAVYHRLPERIRSHALICFMSLVLYRVMRLKAHGSKASPKTELELLWRIQQHKATVGAKEFRGISKATHEQLDIFTALEVAVPKNRCSVIFQMAVPSESKGYAANCRKGTSGDRNFSSNKTVYAPQPRYAAGQRS